MARGLNNFNEPSRQSFLSISIRRMISRRLVLIFFVEQTNSRLSLQANDRKPVNVSRISSSVTRVNQLCRVGLSFLARLSAD